MKENEWSPNKIGLYGIDADARLPPPISCPSWMEETEKPVVPENAGNNQAVGSSPKD